MQQFSGYLFNKHVDHLAEKCVRNNIPICEFVDWYVESALAGAGWGAAAGGIVGGAPGAAIGAGVGAGVGHLYNKFNQYYNKYANKYAKQQPQEFDQAKTQAVQALMKLAQVAPNLKQSLDPIVASLNKSQQGQQSNSWTASW